MAKRNANLTALKDRLKQVKEFRDNKDDILAIHKKDGLSHSQIREFLKKESGIDINFIDGEIAQLEADILEESQDYGQEEYNPEDNELDYYALVPFYKPNDQHARTMRMTREQLEIEKQLTSVSTGLNKRSKLGTIVFLVIFIVAWTRAFGNVRQLYRMLAGTPPEMIYFKLFPPIFMDMLVLLAILGIPMTIWSILVIDDNMGMIGLDDGPGTFMIIFEGIFRLDLLKLFVYTNAVTWIFAYFYTFILHATHAPIRKYKLMANQLFYFHLIFTSICVIWFIYVAP